MNLKDVGTTRRIFLSTYVKMNREKLVPCLFGKMAQIADLSIGNFSTCAYNNH